MSNGEERNKDVTADWSEGGHFLGVSQKLAK